jgi:hypothetical protein
MNNQFFELNKLSDLHDNKNIFFCKTDYLDKDFDYISKLDNEIILISGNSDYPITDYIVNKVPNNIKKWYCQNAQSFSDLLEPIPLGLENGRESIREGHGVSYTHRAHIKEDILSNLSNIQANNFIYANFNLYTNLNYRTMVKETIVNLNYINWEDPILGFDILFNRFLSHKMVLCPPGNGIDTHRLWEILYCNRVPITIKIGSYKIYELYSKLPILVIDDVELLKDKQYIEKEYEKIMNTTYDLSLININYWINTITHTK